VRGARGAGVGVVAAESVEALYSRAGEKMREALHVGVRKALAVVSSHYVDIDLPAVCEGYILPDDESEVKGPNMARGGGE